VTGFLLSNQKLNNIRKLLNYLLIIFLPTQVGKHFWPDFSSIKGARVDYLSPTLYFTDMLILLVLVLWIFSKNKFSIFNFPYFAKASRGKQFSIKSKFSIVILTFSLIIGIFISKSPFAGVYGLVKLMEFGFLGIYTAKNINKLKFQNILLMFSVGIIFESVLAIIQYFNHGSIQGIFYFFGERFFNSQTPGIANASLGGELVLRPYGTFSHPNVLAGYLLIGMTLIVGGIKNHESRIKGAILILTLIIGTIALFLTLSRIAIALWLLILIFCFIRKFMIHNSLFIILFLVGILTLGLATPLGLRFTDIKLTDESIVQRESLIQSSIVMIKDNPLFGVGLNNFLINLPAYQKPSAPLSYLQPVHNIFLLVMSETGIIGFSFFVWFLIKTYRRINSYFIIYPLSLIIILGLFDHYFLTLQQGQLLFSFVLGLCWSKSPKRNY